MTIEQSMRDSNLFEGLDDEEISALIDCLQCRRVDFSRGDIIAFAGQPQKYIGLVLTGKLTLAKENPSGHRILIATIGPAESFGEMNAFSGSRTWPVTVTSEKGGSILVIPIDRIGSSCEKKCFGHWSLIVNLLRSVSQKALVLSHTLDYLGIKGIRRKLATLILKESSKSGSLTFKMSLTRTQMADYFLVSRPALSNELCKLRDEGLLRFSGDNFEIIDETMLQQIADADV